MGNNYLDKLSLLDKLDLDKENSKINYLLLEEEERYNLINKLLEVYELMRDLTENTWRYNISTPTAGFVPQSEIDKQNKEKLKIEAYLSRFGSLSDFLTFVREKDPNDSIKLEVNKIIPDPKKSRLEEIVPDICKQSK